MKEDEAQPEVTFRFVVNQVSMLPFYKSVLSPPSYVRNFAWKMEVCLPKKKHAQRFLGVYLICGNESSSWACYAVAEFRLLPVRPAVPPITRKTQHLFSSEGDRSWGHPSFMPWADVLDMEKGYIKDDSITLEVHIVEGDEIAKQLRDLEAKFEEEKKQKTVAIAAHKKLEGDLKEAKNQVKFQYKVVEDALKQLKRSEQHKEPTQGAKEAQTALNELADSSKDEKRKGNTLEAELFQLTEDLANCTRAQRATKAEHDELQEEMTSDLENEKRRLEAKIVTLEKELEEEQSNNEVLADKLRKTQLSEKRHESSRLLLECQIKDLTTKLIELDALHRSESKATITTLENKITNLEEQLLAEVKERLAQQNQSRKLDIKLKEFEIQLEKEKRNVHQYKEEVEETNARVKAVKRRLEEAEEENSREKAQKHKVKRKLDDVVESNKAMTGEISNLKNIIRRNAGDTDLASSRIGALKYGSLKPEENGSRNDCTTQNRA